MTNPGARDSAVCPKPVHKTDLSFVRSAKSAVFERRAMLTGTDGNSCKTAKYIMALDAGTTSCRAVVFDKNMNMLCIKQQVFTQFFTPEGYAEHDAEEIYSVCLQVLEQAAAEVGATAKDIAGIGLTNQRETTVVWDKNTGKPLYKAIVWQCLRSAEICEKTISDGMGEYIQKATGLIVDAYFSATKLKWILDNVPGVSEAAERGAALFGTIDSWLLWKATGVHATEYTNAARTMLFNINTLQWDEKILDYYGIPARMLPQVKYSDEIFGSAEILGGSVALAGIAGDQQAALFGQRCFAAGEIKNTYGTGCFILCNIGRRPVISMNKLLCTIGVSVKKLAVGETDTGIRYALEGSVFNAGSLVQWLRDDLGILETAAQSEDYALNCENTGGVYIVPAFSGMGAPYWDMYARGSISGLTRGTGRAELARAALESIAHQTADVISCVCADTGIKISRICADGGATANNLLMQIQANIGGFDVVRPQNIESTALGAAFLCGLATGFWSIDEIKSFDPNATVFLPKIGANEREPMRRGWRKAVERALGWAGEHDGAEKQ